MANAIVDMEAAGIERDPGGCEAEWGRFENAKSESPGLGLHPPYLLLLPCKFHGFLVFVFDRKLKVGQGVLLDF